jgi:hypothetical protein
MSRCATTAVSPRHLVRNARDIIVAALGNQQVAAYSDIDDYRPIQYPSIAYNIANFTELYELYFNI